MTTKERFEMEKLSRAKTIQLLGDLYHFSELSRQKSCYSLLTQGEIKDKILHGHLIGLLSSIASKCRTRILELDSTPESVTKINYFLPKEFFVESKDDLIMIFSVLVVLSNRIGTLTQKDIDPLVDLPTLLILEEIKTQIIIFKDKSVLSELNCREVHFLWPNFEEPLLERGLNTDMLPLPILFHKPTKIKKLDKPVFVMNDLSELFNTPELTKAFFHFILIDIEISAMQICAHMILKNQDMPFDFSTDLSKQIFDEARHAVVMQNFLENLGGEIGDYHYNDQSRTKYMTSPLLHHQLAIQQYIQEGDTYQDSLNFIDYLKNTQRTEMARIFDFVNSDEADHAKIGEKWLLHLAEGNDIKLKKFVKQARLLIDAKEATNDKVPKHEN
jgi:uncharacterized ferritin-like protein (DUF455 family)